jgi:clan AA aspartic protease (TIGR02281 family)
MRCPKCNITLQSHYAFCPRCGERIGPERRRLWKAVGVIGLLAAALGLIALGYQHAVRPPSDSVTPRQFPAQEPLPRILPSVHDAVEDGISISAGRIIIEDIAGNTIANMVGAVTDSGWVAVPAKLGIGGCNWYFVSRGERLEIIGGRIGDHDIVGIWQLKEMDRFPGPRLAAGNPSQPLRWISVVSELALDLPRAEIVSEQQNFLVAALPPSIREPGVFVQDKAVVGWSFGPFMEHGYIWRGPGEENLVYELSVSDYYRATFENSREERFILAYARKDADPLEQLRLFADGFRRPSGLPEQEMPPHLSAQAVLPRMHDLLSRLVRAGRGDDIFSVIDAGALNGAGDADLLIAALSHASHAHAVARAVGITEEALRRPESFRDPDEARIREFLLEMYGRWMNLLTEAGDYTAGMAVYERAVRSMGDAPRLRLMGAQLALAFGDWRTAENIIGSQWFPLEMADQVRQMEERIRSLKPGANNAVMIRFAADAGQIGVHAMLHHRLSQRFMVDTGASVVTIPISAARQLGIYDASAPRKRLVTAGGIVFAPSVMIDALEIGGRTEYGVEALVLDLPEHPDIGLLGMNYLNRFKMEVNADEGILILTPR